MTNVTIRPVPYQICAVFLEMSEFLLVASREAAGQVIVLR